MPENTVYVGRPTKWGNPFKCKDGWQGSFQAVAMGCRGDARGRHAAVVRLFRIAMMSEVGTPKKDTRTWMDKELTYELDSKMPTHEEIRNELKGKNLACWCPLDQPCHADVLLEIANCEGGKPDLPLKWEHIGGSKGDDGKYHH